MSIRIGILGYGNLGKGVECAIRQNPDMELTAVFTRRNPESVTPLTEGVKVYSVDDAKNMTDKIDVMILCGGRNLPVCSIRSTALIPMRRFLSILKLLMRPQKQEIKSALSP